jgi:hypothetical protein
MVEGNVVMVLNCERYAKIGCQLRGGFQSIDAGFPVFVEYYAPAFEPGKYTDYRDTQIACHSSEFADVDGMDLQHGSHGLVNPGGEVHVSCKTRYFQTEIRDGVFEAFAVVRVIVQWGGVRALRRQHHTVVPQLFSFFQDFLHRQKCLSALCASIADSMKSDLPGHDYLQMRFLICDF